MRGADYRAADTLGALVAATAAALAAAAARPGDGVHRRPRLHRARLGCTSPAWRFQLAHVDRLAEQLAGVLPAGTALHVTADHGMTDVPPAERIDADLIPALRDGVAAARRGGAGPARLCGAGRSGGRARGLAGYPR